MADTYTPSALLAEALCTWEAFRRLGYPADDIFLLIGWDEEGQRVLCVEARWPVIKRKFVVKVGLITEAEDKALGADWEQAATWWNAENGNGLYEKSQVFAKSVAFLSGLASAGMMRIHDPERRFLQ